MGWGDTKEKFPVGCEVMSYGWRGGHRYIGKVVGHTDKQVKVLFDRFIPRRGGLPALMNEPQAKTHPATVLELWTRKNERRCVQNQAEIAKDNTERAKKPYEEALAEYNQAKAEEAKAEEALAAFDAETKAMIAAGTITEESMNEQGGR
jgi:hypothetical protein